MFEGRSNPVTLALVSFVAFVACLWLSCHANALGGFMYYMQYGGAIVGLVALGAGALAYLLNAILALVRGFLDSDLLPPREAVLAVTCLGVLLWCSGVATAIYLVQRGVTAEMARAGIAAGLLMIYGAVLVLCAKEQRDVMDATREPV